LARGILLGSLFAISATFLLGYDGLQRIDHLFYDAIVKIERRPANDEVVIVAIDEESLRQLGRWPWPRSTHAKVIDRLTGYGVSAIGIDILFSERDINNLDADSLLASAIEASNRVTLVVGPEGGESDRHELVSEVLPLPEFAIGASLLSHIDTEVDIDGICRRVYLRAGLGNPHWPAMGLALFQIAHPDRPLPETGADNAKVVSGAGWLRDSPVLISYAGPPGHIKRVSYVNVLNDLVPAEQLKDKIVLIGTTAIGLGDNLATPLSSIHTLMPGVEVNANLLASILDEKLMYEGSADWQITFTLLSTFFLLLWLLLIPGRLSLTGLFLSATTTVAVSIGLLNLLRIWVPPTAPLFLQFALYIVWNWLDLGKQNRLSRLLRSEIHSQARRDRITGLPNQHLLRERMLELLDEKSTSAFFSLLIVNIGKHRTVLDVAGSKGIRSLLKQTSRRLDSAVQNEHEIYRLDGVEFAVLLTGVSSIDAIKSIADRLTQSLLRPFTISEYRFTLSPSIGVVRSPKDGKNVSDLIDNAYAAMHKAREDSNQRVFLFSTQIGEDLSAHAQIHQELRQESWRDHLTCMYQPQLSTSTGQLVGVETLVRWHHPTLGTISPALFIPLAEREGLISPIGTWVLNEACKQGMRWQKNFSWKIRIAVNVSANQLNSHDIISTIKHALVASGIPPHYLELELTESALIDDKKATLTRLNTIKKLGVELAIDDFGTGYSSLAYLKEFPMNRIKIDQSFIQDLHESSESVAIAQSIIAMASELKMEVIAEGVEVPEHLEILKRLGCDEVQGYLLGKPMTASELERTIQTGHLSVLR